MTRLMFCGDVHIADRPPAGRTDAYRSQVMDKLREIGKAAGEGEMDAVILLGDLFHQPRANLVSHSLVRELAEVFSAYPCPIYAVAGNHDLAEDGMASLHRQPLGVLAEAGVLTVPTKPVEVGYVSLFFRHYDHRRDVDPTYYELSDDEILGYQNGLFLMVAHGSLVAPGEERAYPVLDVSRALWDVQAVISGHLHESVSVTKFDWSEGTTLFANPGSLTRVARDKHNMTRKPYVLCLDFDVEDWELDWYDYELECTLPASEVFLEREVEQEAVSSELKEFAAALSQGLDQEFVDLDQLLSQFTDISPKVREHVKRFLVEAEA